MNVMDDARLISATINSEYGGAAWMKYVYIFAFAGNGLVGLPTGESVRFSSDLRRTVARISREIASSGTREIPQSGEKKKKEEDKGHSRAVAELTIGEMKRIRRGRKGIWGWRINWPDSATRRLFRA